MIDLELVGGARHLAVDRVARMMAAALDDPASVRYFAGLLWRALRDGWLYALAQQLERLMAEVGEGGVRKVPAFCTPPLAATGGPEKGFGYFNGHLLHLPRRGAKAPQSTAQESVARAGFRSGGPSSPSPRGAGRRERKSTRGKGPRPVGLGFASRAGAPNTAQA